MTDPAILEKDDRPSIVETFQATTYKIIYIYSVPYEDRAGHLKIGDATLHTDKPLASIEQKDIDEAANKRIREQNYTAKSQFKLEHAELAIRSLPDDESKLEGFRDHQVHTVLKNSGFSKGGDIGGEWFKVALEVAKAAIEATKNHQLWLKDGEAVKAAIVLRPEQIKAIADTLKVFRAGSVENPKRMLWNAKMRFGKTLTAYGLVAKLEAAAKSGDSEGPKRILIMTHRPDVHDGWLADFKKSELAGNGWTFGSKRTDSSWDRVSKTDKFVWFASIQDLRGSFGQELSEEEFKKNQELFGSSWDIVISDEVHEGTLTQLAKRVYQELRANYFLDLSGTPFNVIQAESWEDEGLAERFSYHGQYNWSYPDERRAKDAWEKDHPGESNPYADCPEIRFITYDISAAIPSLVVDENASASISFTELFSTEKDSKGKLKFKNEGQVRALLFKMLGSEEHSDDASLFPYSPSFRTQFRHTLWMLPNVDACGAMENLLNEVSSGFAGFTVVNATGRGASGWTERNSLDEVKKAIKTSQNTITLSQGMLTTGVTVPEWTAVFMFNNTTSPMLYMQTAFRAASAGSLDDGRSKDVAYVFDFNPDRCLRQIVEIAKANAHVPAGTDAFDQESAEKASVEDYLKYISVLALKGSVFKAPDSNAIMEQLNEAYINEIVSKGFDSPLLWNNRELNNFDIKKAQILEALRKIAGGKENDYRNSVKVSEITEEEKQRLLELRKQEKTQDPPPSKDDKKEKAELEAKEKTERKNRANAVSILVGIAARMPMLVFASPADQAITPQNFNELIDEESWKEFMPKNLRRLMPAGTPSLEERQESALGDEGNILYWDDVRRFFDPKMFSMASERIRQLAREAFEKSPVERALRLYAIFATFKRPDKETILTPARVVELQYSKTLGGLGLIDLENSTAKNVLIRMRRLAVEDADELNDPLESHPLQKAVKLLDEGTHELAPQWVTSDVDPVENDGKDFWENKSLSVYDINSKTALYPLYAATSTWWANRPAYRAWREAEEAKTFTDEELDADLWKEVVEKVIYLNVRVPYSARIARRVLTGFDESIRVNSTVVDVIRLKQAIAEWNSISKANRKTGWAKIENEHEFIGVILRLANTGFIQEHAPDLWKKLNKDEDYRKIDGILGKINEGDVTMEEFKKLKDLVDSVKNNPPKWGVTVGNPPYQVASSNEPGSPSDAVYSDFAMISETMSEFVSMVFPSKWASGGGRGSSLREYRNRSLQSKNFCKYILFQDGKSLFPDSDTGSLNIFLWHRYKTDGNLEYIVYPNYAEIRETISSTEYLIQNPADSILASKIGALRALSELAKPNNLFGTQGSQWSNVQKKYKRDSNVFAWVVSKKGTGIERIPVLLDPSLKEVSSWKVFTSRTANRVSSSGRARHDRIWIGKPHETSGFSFLRFGDFSSESEAVNCLLYIKTDFVNYLHSLLTVSQNTAVKNTLTVPLLDFSTGEILDKPGTFLDFSKPETLDDQLAEIYGITEEEREFMRKDLKPWKDKVDVEADR